VAVLDGDVRITAESATNSLIIQGSAQAYDALVPVIEKLDVRRPQVLIEGLVLEVQVSEGETLGTNLIYNTLAGGRPFGASSLPSGGIPPDLIAGNDPDPDDLPDDINPGAALGAIANTLFSATVIGNRTVNIGGQDLPVISAVIEAAQSDNDTNIMAAPQILTADNTEAQIVVGENRPFPTQQLQALAPGTNTGFQTSTQIERRDVGLKLRVTPQISEGDTVRLKIFTEISNVTEAESALGPTTNNRVVENTVYVSDGASVLIGGIIQDRVSKGRQSVPILGDLPVIGQLFGSDTGSVVKTNLLLLLTPHIVRVPQDLEQLTLERRERFREAAGDPEQDPERRRKALEAGIDLPNDPNPVRRELESHAERYPTERLPELREERERRESGRREKLESQTLAPDPAETTSEPPGVGASSAVPELRSEPPTEQPPESAAPAPQPAPPPGEASRSDTHAAQGEYLVQIEPLEDSGEALALLAQLNASGYSGTLVLQPEAKTVLHFIRIGPYRTEAEARRAGQAVEKQTELDAFVMLAP
jgi:cell division septation protein DedD